MESLESRLKPEGNTVVLQNFYTTGTRWPVHTQGLHVFYHHSLEVELWVSLRSTACWLKSDLTGIHPESCCCVFLSLFKSGLLYSLMMSSDREMPWLNFFWIFFAKEAFVFFGLYQRHSIVCMQANDLLHGVKLPGKRAAKPPHVYVKASFFWQLTCCILLFRLLEVWWAWYREAAVMGGTHLITSVT